MHKFRLLNNWRFRSFLLCIVVLLFFIFLVYPTAMKYSQSYKFADEDEHLTIAGLMLRHELKLYSDISTNHQPFNYYSSKLIQEVSQPQNVLMLIRRHRQAIVLFSLLWSILFVIRFGLPGLVFVIIVEILKYSLLGNEFLAESLALYPFGYVFGSQLELMTTKKYFREDFLLGLVTGFAILTLLPLLPALILLLFYRYFIAKVGYWRDFLLAVGMIIVLSLILFNPVDYVRETWINNVLYAAPRLSEIHSLADWSKLWLYPVLHLFVSASWLTMWIWWILFAWISILAILVWRKDFNSLKLYGLLFLIWGIGNMRVIKPGVSIYGGFHLLPWLSIGLMVPIFYISSLYKRSRNVIVLLIILLFLTGSYLFIDSNSPLMTKIDPATQNYIQYTPTNQVSEVIQSISSPEDRLMVFPNEAIIHWSTNLKPADRQVTHYEWQYHDPIQYQAYSQAIENMPPTFIQYTFDGSSYTSSVEALIDKQYIKIFENPDLFVHESKIASLSKKQLDQFYSLPFEVLPLE